MLDSDENSLQELQNLDYIVRLKLLEQLLTDLKKNPSPNVHRFAAEKRNFLRSMKDGERRRPGWELAYGKKRKRSILEELLNEKK